MLLASHVSRWIAIGSVVLGAAGGALAAGPLDTRSKGWAASAAEGPVADPVFDDDFEGSITDWSDVVCGTDILLDGGFEGGPGGGDWVESSTNFGTPICDASCGLGGGTGPRTGTFWAWFGGIDAAETATASQALTIPVGIALLRFQVEVPACDTTGTDTFSVRVDGGTIASTTNVTDAACNLVGYAERWVDLEAFADGGVHTIEFRGVFTSQGSGVTSFMVDDSRLQSCQ